MYVYLHTGGLVMIITFCGHSDFNQKDLLSDKMIEIFNRLVGDREAYFYLGGYGEFDNINLAEINM